MNIDSTLLLILGMAVVTYITRRAFLHLPSSLFSPRLRHGLTFIPVGIFAGLIFPSLFVNQGEFVIQPLYLLSSVVCLGVMMWSRNVLLSFSLSLLVVVLGSVLAIF